MTIVNRYQCDDCKGLGNELEGDVSDISILNSLKCIVKGKEIIIDKDKHFCSPACFINYIHKLITANGNGLFTGKIVPL